MNKIYKKLREKIETEVLSEKKLNTVCDRLIKIERVHPEYHQEYHLTERSLTV